MPKVSVVIPLYEKELYVEASLRSVLKQTFQDFEVIVVDDGSKDDGPALVQRCGDPRVSLIRQANAGPGAARNAGIQLSKAPLVAFLDADDEWEPEYLEVQVASLEEHPSAAASIVGHYRGESMEQHFRERGIQAGLWRLPPTSEPASVKSAVDFMHSGATVVRRAALEHLGCFYSGKGCTYGEDTFLWIQLLFQYPLFRDPFPRMRYRIEASELGVGRKTVTPVWPMLTEPESIRAACPAEYQRLLEEAFAYYALVCAARQARAGQAKVARQLMLKYPRMASLTDSESASLLRELHRSLRFEKLLSLKSRLKLLTGAIRS